MTSNRKYTGQRFGEGGRYASRQEMQVSKRYPHLQYQPKIQIAYTQDFVYLPDWRLGRDKVTGLFVYIEGKELFDTDMCAKYEAIVNCNPALLLLILTPNIYVKDRDRLNAHPRIEVIVSRYIIPEEWLERTNGEETTGADETGTGGERP
jgi:hypothetical protein